MTTEVSVQTTVTNVTIQGTGASVSVESPITSVETGVAAIINVAGGASDVTAGSANPSSPPTSLGARYLNTTTGQCWIGIGTSSVSDWREVFLGGSP